MFVRPSCEVDLVGERKVAGRDLNGARQIQEEEKRVAMDLVFIIICMCDRALKDLCLRAGLFVLTRGILLTEVNISGSLNSRLNKHHHHHETEVVYCSANTRVAQDQL